MLNNLKAEIVRKKVLRKDLAEKIGIHPHLLTNRLEGRTEFHVSEVIKIMAMPEFKDLKIQYLFKDEK